RRQGRSRNSPSIKNTSYPESHRNFCHASARCLCLPLRRCERAYIDSMNTAIGNMVTQGRIDQLLFLYRSQAFKNAADRGDIVVTPLPLNVKLTIPHVIL